MVVLRDVQHRRLSFRSVPRLSLVCSWSPPSTHQGSRVRQGYGVREAFWEPCSVARRAASATISDFRIRDTPFVYEWLQIATATRSPMPELFSTALTRMILAQS